MPILFAARATMPTIFIFFLNSRKLYFGDSEIFSLNGINKNLLSLINLHYTVNPPFTGSLGAQSRPLFDFDFEHRRGATKVPSFGKRMEEIMG